MTTVNSSTSLGTSSSAESAQTGLTANYELFLRILTTQVQNQDPLDPMDSAEYTSQLVQYTNVEQSIQTNKKLEELIAMQESSHTMNYVNYIGKEISADASTALLSNGYAEWSVEVDEYAAGTYEIRNGSGAVVYTGETSLDAGKSKIEWNGLADSGSRAVDGTYSIHFNLKDGDGRQETVTTAVKGVVDSVDWSSGQLLLKVGDQDIPISAVVAVSQAT